MKLQGSSEFVRCACELIEAAEGGSSFEDSINRVLEVNAFLGRDVMRTLEKSFTCREDAMFWSKCFVRTLSIDIRRNEREGIDTDPRSLRLRYLLALAFWKRKGGHGPKPVPSI